jgi:predicted DNA-binding transcriptional regulator
MKDLPVELHSLFIKTESNLKEQCICIVSNSLINIAPVNIIKIALVRSLAILEKIIFCRVIILFQKKLFNLNLVLNSGWIKYLL